MKCKKCNIDMEFIDFVEESDLIEYPDELWRCPKCGEEAYVN